MPLRRWFVPVLLVMATPFLNGQPVQEGSCWVFNDASRSSPYNGIAPGSLIQIGTPGFQVGPAAARIAPAFPLVTELAGTTVTVTAGGQTLNAYVLATESGWIKALLPSSTPVGMARLAARYNGREIACEANVTARSIGLYSGEFVPPSYLAPSFFTPRSVQNLDASGGASANSFAAPARPGGLVSLWGTGLGAAAGDEVLGPIPGQMRIPGLEVMVGDRPAALVYAGRSGCCAGLDEIIFEVPGGVEGCNVPVGVRLGEERAWSNDVKVSIAAGQGVCSDPNGFSQAEIGQLTAGKLNAAGIGALSGPNGSWWAMFGKASTTSLLPYGTCGQGGGPWMFEVSARTDVGSQLNIGTPRGALTASRGKENYYNGLFDGQIDAGRYTIDNGSGGPGGGSFRAQFSIAPENFNWSLDPGFSSANWPDGLTVSWSGADRTGYVAIIGTYSLDGETCGGCSFVCYEKPEKGKFTVPWRILEKAGAGSTRFNQLGVTVMHRPSMRLSIPGFDVAEFVLDGPLQRKDLDWQ